MTGKDEGGSRQTMRIADCDREVYANGTLVLITHTIAPADMEMWVQKVAKLSGQRVDWHFAGGRACVLALGDLAAVRQAILDLKAAHDELQRAKAMSYGHCRLHDYEPNWLLYGPDEWNPAHELARGWNVERETSR